jgi:hypothetical protein
MLMMITASGCALHYYDPATQTEHVWGLAHVRMKVAPANEGVQAVVKGTTVVGASLKIAPDDKHLSLGFDKSTQMAVASEGASVRLEWPKSDLFSVRVGSRPPFLPAGPEVENIPIRSTTGGGER